jgi:2-oxoglutarate ferredoxin oxidoreductase subunit alpha
MEKFLPYCAMSEWRAPLGHSRHEAGLQHRIGGIEKEDKTGNISYEPLNHEKMVRCARRKCAHRGGSATAHPFGQRPGKRRPADRGLGQHVRRHPTAVNEIAAEGHSVATCICGTSSPSTRSSADADRVTSAC